MNKVPKGTKFIKGPKGKKYTAIIPTKTGTKRVSFGSVGYAQYRDSVPKSMGGGKYSHLDHLDKKRRNRYRKRHGKIKLKDGTFAYKKKYTPAYLSYNLLW